MRDAAKPRRVPCTASMMQLCSSAASSCSAVPTVRHQQSHGLRSVCSFSRCQGLALSRGWAAAAVAIEVLGPVALILGVAPRWTSLALIAFVIMATATNPPLLGVCGCGRSPSARGQLLQERRHPCRFAVLCSSADQARGAWRAGGSAAPLNLSRPDSR